MQRADSLEKALMLGKIEGKRENAQQRMRWLDSITNAMDMSLSKLSEIVKNRKPGVLQFMGMQRVKHNLTSEQQHFATDVYVHILLSGAVLSSQLLHGSAPPPNEC